MIGAAGSATLDIQGGSISGYPVGGSSALEGPSKWAIGIFVAAFVWLFFVARVAGR